MHHVFLTFISFYTTDEYIVPWQSSHFGFYDEDGKTIIPMEKQKYYIDDTFGLKTLHESGRLTLIEVANKSHGSWLYNRELIKEHVLPNLEDD